MCTDSFKAIKTLDVDWVRRQAVGDGLAAPCRETLLLALHRSRYEMADMPADLRHESGHWLRVSGYSRVFGLALLPEGELPV